MILPQHYRGPGTVRYALVGFALAALFFPAVYLFVGALVDYGPYVERLWK